MASVMATREDYTDASVERRYVAALTPLERAEYVLRNPVYKTIDGDLTDAEWRRYGELRALRGTGVAHAFATEVRRALWRPRHAPGVDAGSPTLTFWCVILTTFFGLAGILGAAYAFTQY